MDEPSGYSPRITTACILAAGTGSRLHPLTKLLPKCLTELHGRSILSRLLSCLRLQGFKRLVFVVGHLEDSIRTFLEEHASDFTIDLVTNPVFASTNNIYSLWLTRDYLNEPFLLAESDLIFDSNLLSELTYPDKIAVSRHLPWMNGTTVTMDAAQHVSKFQFGKDSSTSISSYKTVNLCSLSLSSWQSIVTRLNQYIAAGRVKEYYEVVFGDLVADGTLDLGCVLFDEHRWYEVDSTADLQGAYALLDAKDPFPTGQTRSNWQEPRSPIVNKLGATTSTGTKP